MTKAAPHPGKATASESGRPTRRGRTRRGPPLGRHVAAIGVVLVLGFVFWQLHGGGLYIGGGWNVVQADVSVVLLCLVLMLGPAARFVPRVRPLVPWARELGIAMAVTAGLHLLILLDGRISWDVLGFVFRSTDLGGIDLESILAEPVEFMQTDMWAAANWVGLLALGYAFVLAATSNDWSQRLLGRGWKFVQRQTYTLFVLVWLHTVVWVLLGYGSSFYRWFWAFTTLVVVAQFAGFVHTVRARRGPSPQRAPAKDGPNGRTAAAANWIAVAVLWGGLVFGSLGLAAMEDPAFRLFCEKSEELEQLGLRERVEELRDYVPREFRMEEVVPVVELIRSCQEG